MRNVIYILFFIVFSCKKEESKPAYNYPIKAKIFLFNSSENITSGAYLDFTKNGIIVGSSEWTRGYERRFTYDLNYGQSAPNYRTNVPLYSATIDSDTGFLDYQITINGKTDKLYLYTNKDYIFADLKSSNACEIFGPSKLNRLKPNILWGYIQCKDITFLSYATRFTDSLISTGKATPKKLRPGPYYLFNISNDSLISHLIEQDENQLGGLIIPFIFEYNNDFNLVRNIAEKFTYLPKDKYGLIIYIRDTNNNRRLVKYYL